MTYADEVGLVIRHGRAEGWILDVTHLLDMPDWMRKNYGTTCPTCEGGGVALIALGDAAAGEMVMLGHIRCPQCLGRGEVAYVCAN